MCYGDRPVRKTSSAPLTTITTIEETPKSVLPVEPSTATVSLDTDDWKAPTDDDFDDLADDFDDEDEDEDEDTDTSNDIFENTDKFQAAVKDVYSAYGITRQRAQDYVTEVAAKHLQAMMDEINNTPSEDYEVGNMVGAAAEVVSLTAELFRRQMPQAPQS
jgi:hypothetical protein